MIGRQFIENIAKAVYQIRNPLNKMLEAFEKICGTKEKKLSEELVPLDRLYDEFGENACQFELITAMVRGFEYDLEKIAMIEFKVLDTMRKCADQRSEK